MVGSPKRRRIWSDGSASYEIASASERLGAGVVDWIFAICAGGILGFAGSFAHRVFVSWDEAINDVDGSTAYDGFLPYVISAVAIATIVHLSYVIMVVTSGDTPGHRLASLAIKRKGVERIGWKRAVLRGLAGSPGLVVPYLSILVQQLVSYGSKAFVAGAGFDFWTAAVLIPLVIVPILVVSNHIWMIIDVQNRGFGDIFAGTVVVKNRMLPLDRREAPAPGVEHVGRVPIVGA